MEDREEGRGGTGSILRVLADVAVIGGGWLVLAGTLHLHDLAIALLLGGLAAAGAAGVRRYVGHRPGSVLGWLPLIPSATVGMVRDSLIVSRVLLRRLRGHVPAGRFVTVPFDVGDRSGEAATRRAVATVLVTLQPNSYILGFDEARGVALVHVLDDAQPVPIPDALRGDP